MTERGRRAVLSSVLGLVGPLVFYYGLRALGMSVFLALVIGALVPGALPAAAGAYAPVPPGALGAAVAGPAAVPGHWRRASVGYGIGTLVDAVARVVMAYTLPVDLVPALTTALYLVTSAVLLVAVNVYYARAGLWPMLYGPAAGQPEPVTGSREGRRA